MITLQGGVPIVAEEKHNVYRWSHSSQSAALARRLTLMRPTIKQPVQNAHTDGMKAIAVITRESSVHIITLGLGLGHGIGSKQS